jgi:hypothetical protein
MMTSGLTTTINFGDRFDTAPIVFSTIFSTGRLSAHLRLLEASDKKISIATEYDTCNFVVDDDDHLLAWIVMAPPNNIVALGSVVSQKPTKVKDVMALLSIRASLHLPNYLQWRNGSDPCADRWAGVECRTAGGEDPRVVVLDVRMTLSSYCPRMSLLIFLPP